MFVQMITSEPLTLPSPDLLVEASSSIGVSCEKICFVGCFFVVVVFLQPHFSVMVHHHKPECLVKRLDHHHHHQSLNSKGRWGTKDDWMAVFKVMVTAKVQICSVCPDNIF